MDLTNLLPFLPAHAELRILTFEVHNNFN
ncbi:unnamed protein product [Linum tenue]|uniref:Uncharacterized protein n=1 Tax=Linum tenue TaxID=586396 RepID=A0AAV0KXG5_9ROSI|nr:unnamed protein product [Linum tenue]